MNIPNRITFSRIIFGILMFFFTFRNNERLFFIFYIIAVLSDILDGYFARKFQQVTKFGGRFDILADNFILIFLMFGLFKFRQDILQKYIGIFLFIFAYYLFIQLYNLLLNNKLIFMRTFFANLAAVIFPVVILSLFYYEIKVLIYLYAIIMIISLTEKLYLNMVKKIKKKYLFIIGFLIATALLFLVPIYDPQNNVCFNKKCINVEVMKTPEQRQLGLMFREDLEEENGMLFIFEEPKELAFWMMNVNFPIDIVFINENRKIVSISKNATPCFEEPCERYYSKSDAMYVVEVIAGFSDKYELKNGDEVVI